LHDIFPEVAIELSVLARDGLAARITLALRNWSLRCARLNVVPTRSMAEGLRRWGVSDDRLKIVPYWSEDAVLPVPPDENELRAEWGLSDAFVVGYSGNFGRAHEFQTLLGAATLLHHDPAIRFLLIGGGFGRGRVEEAIRQRGLTNVILRPLQPRERLGESLSAADLHLISLLPSLEPYVVPSKLYGIMAVGRPAIFIGDAYGEVAVALRRNACGEVVAIGAARDLADRIVAIREDVARCARMGTNARKAFETLHTRYRAIAAWVDLLASIEKRGGHVPIAKREAPYSAASGDAAKD
jgi:glycosyltransferase involved in cell wall biosynthesis